MTLWKNLTLNFQHMGHPPIVLHDCHNGCGSNFAGPTLAVAPCSSVDEAQQWTVQIDGAPSALVNGLNGLCAGCASSSGSCGNINATIGLGLEACSVRCSHAPTEGDAAPAVCTGVGMLDGLGQQAQTFNYSQDQGVLRNKQTGSCLQLLGDGPAVGWVSAGSPSATCQEPQQKWDVVPSATSSKSKGVGAAGGV